LVAFSSGSLLNIAQGRVGPHTENAVRWVATLGTDYGVIAVHRESPHQSLQQLMQAVRSNPSIIVFGAGGTLGSQDWMKAALLVRAAGQDPRGMRFVSFEGGGEAIKALEGKHLGVFTGDAAEAMKALAQGARFRTLAVLAPARLSGRLSEIATATEQGVNLVWPTVRGVYMAAGTPDAAVSAWTTVFEHAHAAPGYAALCQEHGLTPHRLTGDALQRFVKDSVEEYRQLARELGLRLWKTPAGPT
jgi:putative tricarboxylic transport membrane protein